MDMNAVIDALGITKEEVTDLAATKVAETVLAEMDCFEGAQNEVKRRVTSELDKSLKATIESTLQTEFEKILSSEYQPTDMWGEPNGEPTSIRDRLYKNAVSFWETKVDKDGKPGGYGKEPRHEWLFKKVVNQALHDEIKQHYTNIVGALKDSLTDTVQADIGKHLNKILAVRSRGDLAKVKVR